jgi:hypothetical protein
MSTYNKNFISSIHFLDKREILSQVLDVQNEDPSFLDVMEGMRRSVPTSSAIFHNYVNEPVYEKLTLTGTAAGDNLTNAKIRKGDVIVDVANNTMWFVKNNASLEGSNIVKLGGSGTSIADGATVVVISNAHGEGSGAPAGLKYGLKKYSNKVQIFKNSYQLTDVELTNKISVQFNGQEYYMYAAQHNALMKFRNDIAYALLFGKGNASTFSGFGNDYTAATTSGQIGGVAVTQVVDADGNPIQFTKGLVEWCKDGLDFAGSAGDANAMGSAGLADFAEFVKVMDKTRAPYEYMLFAGTGAKIQLDNLFKNLGSSGVTSVRLNVAGTAVDFGMEQVKLYGRNFIMKAFPQFSHVAGEAAIANASETVLFVPNDKIKVHAGSGTVDRMRVRYLEGPNTNLAYKEWMLGGLAPTPTDGRSVLEAVYESAQGLEILGVEHFGIAQFA